MMSSAPQPTWPRSASKSVQELLQLKQPASSRRRKPITHAKLIDKQFISPQALELAKSAAKVTAMHWLKSKTSWRGKICPSHTQLELRTISSPISGVAVDRYMSAGERVEPKPIIKIAQIDPLRVAVIAPASRFNSIKQGTQATVTPELKDVGAMNVHVIQVDAVINAASNTFRVRLEMPNPHGEIPPGLRCKIAFSK
jgi:cobalt-zinc-cadmium efflux system membrane fusion protein